MNRIAIPHHLRITKLQRRAVVSALKKTIAVLTLERDAKIKEMESLIAQRDCLELLPQLDSFE